MVSSYEDQQDTASFVLFRTGWIRSQIVFYLLGHFYDFREKKGGTAEMYP